MICEDCGGDKTPQETGNELCTCSGGKKEYRVGICYEVGAVMNMTADSEEEAEEKVKKILDYKGLGESGNFDTVHRDYWTQDAEQMG